MRGKFTQTMNDAMFEGVRDLLYGPWELEIEETSRDPYTGRITGSKSHMFDLPEPTVENGQVLWAYKPPIEHTIVAAKENTTINWRVFSNSTPICYGDFPDQTFTEGQDIYVNFSGFYVRIYG